MSISVIIACRNDRKRLDATVKNMYAGWSGKGGLEFVIVDDASDEGNQSDPSLPTRYVKVRTFRNEAQIGPGACRQVGASCARGDILVFTDAHMEYPPDWDTFIEGGPLNRTLLCSTYASDVPFADWWYRGLMIGGADQIHFAGRPSSLANPYQWLAVARLEPRVPALVSDGSYPVPAVIGACYAIEAEWFEYLGGFKGLHGYGGDEQLLSWKSWLAGGTVHCSADLIVKHLNSGPIVEHDLNQALINCFYVEKVVMGCRWPTFMDVLPFSLMPLAIAADGRPVPDFPREVDPDAISAFFRNQSIDHAIQMVEELT